MQWTKRLLALALALTLTIIAAVPVSAASDLTNDTLLNVLDYCTVNGTGGNNVAVSAGGSFSFNWGFTVPIYAIDAVVNITGSLPSAVYLVVNGISYKMNFVNIMGNLYRIYGAGPGGLNSASASIKYTSTGTTYTTVMSFKVRTVSVTYADTTANIYFDDGLNAVSNYGDYVSISSRTEYTEYHYSAEIRLTDWKLYDYIDLCFWTRKSTVTTVSANQNGVVIPITVSTIIADGDDPYIEYNSGAVVASRMLDDIYVTVRVDLRGLNRSSSYIPCVTVNGAYNAWQGMYMGIDYAEGGVIVENPSPIRIMLSNLTTKLSSWFSNLQLAVTNALTVFQKSMESWFTDTVSAIEHVEAEITYQFNALFLEMQNNLQELQHNLADWFYRYFGQDATESEEFGETAETQVDEMEGLQEEMQETTRPSVDDIETDLDDYVSSDDMANYAEQISELTNNTLIVQMLMIVLTVALVAYILYGKR